MGVGSGGRLDTLYDYTGGYSWLGAILMGAAANLFIGILGLALPPPLGGPPLPIP